MGIAGVERVGLRESIFEVPNAVRECIDLLVESFCVSENESSGPSVSSDRTGANPAATDRLPFPVVREPGKRAV